MFWSLPRTMSTEALATSISWSDSCPRGKLLHPGDVQPGAFEDRLAFEFVELRRDRVAERHRPGAQFG